MNLLREYIRDLLSEQANPTLDKIIKLVKTGHEGQAFEFMFMMPEELDATTVVTALRDDIIEFRATTRPPEPGSWAKSSTARARPPDPDDVRWGEFGDYSEALSMFIYGKARRLDPDNWNYAHRARPSQEPPATTDRWPSAEDMIQALQQRIDEAE